MTACSRTGGGDHRLRVPGGERDIREVLKRPVSYTMASDRALALEDRLA